MQKEILNLIKKYLKDGVRERIIRQSVCFDLLILLRKHGTEISSETFEAIANYKDSKKSIQMIDKEIQKIENNI